MSVQLPADDEVVALRYDEPAAAEELARWCDGPARFSRACRVSKGRP